MTSRLSVGSSLRTVGIVAGLLGTLICATQSLAQPADQVRIRLETTDLGGNPIATAGLGDNILLKTFVQDLRTTAPLGGFGVFAAYMDVTYASSLVALTGPIQFAAPYINLQTGDTSVAGLVDEVGAFDGPTPLGTAERLIFSLPFQANAIGTALFASDPAEDLPKGFVLVYGMDDEVPSSRVDYGSASLSIVPEPGAVSLLAIGLLGVFRQRRHRGGHGRTGRAVQPS